MRRLLPRTATALFLGLTTACAVNMGAPRDIPLPTVAIRTGSGASPQAAAQLITDATARVALVAGPADSAWFSTVAETTGLTLSGPATDGELGLGFLAGEPVGDTTVVLGFEGGSLTVRDALYDLAEQRYLDLMAFQVQDAATVRPAMSALLEYMAADVINSAAVVMAVAVPDAAVGDSVARMLSPAYFDALRCEPGMAAPSERGGLRLFYGPEARVYCGEAVTEDAALGDAIRASLIMGRR